MTQHLFVRQLFSIRSIHIQQLKTELDKRIGNSLNYRLNLF